LPQRRLLKVYARLDESTYPTKIKVADEQIAAVNLTGDSFHAEWNYQITPNIPLLINE